LITPQSLTVASFLRLGTVGSRDCEYGSPLLSFDRSILHHIVSVIPQSLLIIKTQLGIVKCSSMHLL